MISQKEYVRTSRILSYIYTSESDKELSIIQREDVLSFMKINVDHLLYSKEWDAINLIKGGKNNILPKVFSNSVVLLKLDRKNKQTDNPIATYVIDYFATKKEKSKHKKDAITEFNLLLGNTFISSLASSKQKENMIKIFGNLNGKKYLEDYITKCFEEPDNITNHVS